MPAIHANSLESVNSSLSFSAAILLLAGSPLLGVVPGKRHMQSAGLLRQVQNLKTGQVTRSAQMLPGCAGSQLDFQ